MVHLRVDGKSYYRWLHRIVAETFLDNPENKPQVNHSDGDKSNNSVDNLEWVTPKENIRHAFENNLRQSGEKSSNAKLTTKEVEEICKLLEENRLSLKEIADKVGVKYYLVFFIYKKKTWTNISDNYDFSKFNCFSPNRGKSKLDEEKVIEICKLLKSGIMTGKDIAKKYNVHENAIYDIKSGKTWKDITTIYFKS